MTVIKRRVLLLIILFSAVLPQLIYSQIGNTNGQFDEVIKQAYTLLQLTKNNDKKALKAKYTETSFQSKKEFNKMLSSGNMHWANEILNQNNTPDKNDILISEWKTVSKDIQASTFSVNVTFYFKGKNLKYSNSDDHICYNFIKTTSGDYLFNGIMFFKKSDFINVKKISDNSK